MLNSTRDTNSVENGVTGAVLSTYNALKILTSVRLTAARSSARLKELGPMKIKPTLVGFSGE